MESKNAKVYVASIKNLSNKLEKYGDADIANLSLLKLIYKYACYSTTDSQLQRLDEMVSQLQIEDKMICSERMAAKGSDYNWVVPHVVVTGGDATNLAPTLGDISITVTDGITAFGFTDVVLYENYSDDSGNSPSGFVIKTLPASGGLYYDGSIVTIGTLLPNSFDLIFERYPDAISGSDDAYVTTFTFSAFDDDGQVPLESNIATVNVTVDALAITNEPATVGDRAQYSGNRSTTVFSSADFTTEPIAPYFDPEGNDLDAIRIDEVSTANLGVYYLYDAAVSVGQVITKDQLDAGAFYHIGPDANAISTDSFNASVRDNVNMTWVS